MFNKLSERINEILIEEAGFNEDTEDLNLKDDTYDFISHPIRYLIEVFTNEEIMEDDIVYTDLELVNFKNTSSKTIKLNFSKKRKM